ncbi:MAG TPA: NAD(P)-dependent oxidoreductase [Burkholderiales bacterium]|jgi:3-hydroxyisobutyrate dehydrogenase|nr:NAD(P)-dependent oxidoreductase [Burkholderiales bacterium]
MVVGFIGLGRMGELMSANLTRAGFALQTWDKAKPGNRASARAAATGADVLITMVPDGRAVAAAVKAALPGLKRGAVVVDMSSSDPATTRKLARLLAAKGVAMVDAPVSGAVAKARDGTLAIMVGGSETDIARVRPVLEKMGTEIFRCGETGAGHATKALNNYLGAAGTIAGFEALLIGKAFGLDPKTLVAVINASTGKNSTTERKIPQQIFTNAFASGFKLALMSKDVGIAARLAQDAGVPSPYLRQTLKHWRDAERALPAGADHTEMYKYLQSLGRRRSAPHAPRAGR